MHVDEASTAAALTRPLPRRTRPRNGAVRPPLWRASTALVAEAGLALYRFPLDPDLPTLAYAMDPDLVGRVAPFADWQVEPSVAVIHHPREGACVLRYERSSVQGRSSGAPPPTLYGKVYPDGTGNVVDGFLRALHREQARHGVEYPARFPGPVLYAPNLRLLLTEALPGEPLVPQLVKRVLGSVPGDLAACRAALEDAVRESGRVLAVLHGSDLATAPVHSASEELLGIRQELDVVAAVWPDVAEQVRRRVGVLFEDAQPAPDMVLSHGDFTPSQVLLDGRTPAVVDLDTLCWADPALDLGRYLAHLHLLAVKVGGRSAGTLVESLTDQFLGGYGETSARTSSGAAAVDRIAFYKGTTLARTALHSCRQLKSYRLELALSLLDDVHARKVDL